tara:strand:- start:6882 stop:7454 length:573 start_codon:yes stop_codon:yes gene_type:complete
MTTFALTVSGDVNKLTRHLSKTERRYIPTVSVQSVNELAKNARIDAQKKVANDMRLPLKIIRKRFDINGNVKGDRVQYYKATRSKPQALLRVHHRAIPVFQIAGVQTKRGVKAKGGRLYVSAFKPKSGRRAGFVFKRQGKARTPLFVPKVSIRAQIKQEFQKRTTGPLARNNFRRIFNRRLEKKLNTLRA